MPSWRFDGRQQDASEFYTMLTTQSVGDLQPVQWQGCTDGEIEAYLSMCHRAGRSPTTADELMGDRDQLSFPSMGGASGQKGDKDKEKFWPLELLLSSETAREALGDPEDGRTTRIEGEMAAQRLLQGYFFALHA
ncbi:hypothetical protein AK812_SmicGene42335 [Symbiodinium microadriaticum]|uniref:Uncharacterized protein n=1 Tax=Symbiodinium microadriaticum TaxID=2951 RepID=A0A1Q9C3U2_SYMMI|nr:hypothetical protein AK812_SmicGene42335 [Symbiodinium microadriaticum]